MLLNLSETIKRRLYLFNLWCNIAYRSMVLAILLLLIAAKSLKLAEALLGFWILSLVIYSLAIGKMIYTRSDT